MPSFTKGPNYRTPFGRSQYRGSTQSASFDHGTFAAALCPTVTIDGFSQKILQPGTALARVTSAAGGTLAADVGKLGPFDAGASDGRQTTANLVGVNDTYLPWQLMERDVEVAYLYDGVVIQANCFELASGVFVVLTDATKAKLVTNCPGVLYRRASTEL